MKLGNWNNLLPNEKKINKDYNSSLEWIYIKNKCIYIYEKNREITLNLYNTLLVVIFFLYK